MGYEDKHNKGDVFDSGMEMISHHLSHSQAEMAQPKATSDILLHLSEFALFRKTFLMMTQMICFYHSAICAHSAVCADSRVVKGAQIAEWQKAFHLCHQICNPGGLNDCSSHLTALGRLSSQASKSMCYGTIFARAISNPGPPE